MQREEQSYSPLLQCIGPCVLEYEDGRCLQNELVEKRKRNHIPDTFVLCEHPPVITVGKRNEQLVESEIRGMKVVKTNRGGLFTYHGPGQLVIYPVVNLVIRGIGVQQFIFSGLTLLSHVCKAFGLDAEVRLDKAGLWVGENKIGSVGLKIERGITNHGFSLNVNCDLAPFAFFSPCGEVPGRVTSMSEERGREVSIAEVSEVFKQCAERAFNRG